MSFIDEIFDYRYNPFSQAFSSFGHGYSGNPKEVHTIPASAPYFIFLNEIPRSDSPSTLLANQQAGPSFTEVSFSTPPAASQFRAVYGGDETQPISIVGQGTIEFNSADAGKIMEFKYYGMGSIVQKQFFSEFDASLTKIISLTGSGNWIVPNNVSKITAYLMASGGGGGGGGYSEFGVGNGGGGGGGGGAEGQKLWLPDYSVSGTIAYAVGTKGIGGTPGGSSGAPGVNGTTGGDVSLDGNVVKGAGGGAGGGGANGVTPGTGGAAGIPSSLAGGGGSVPGVGTPGTAGISILFGAGGAGGAGGLNGGVFAGTGGGGGGGGIGGGNGGATPTNAKNRSGAGGGGGNGSAAGANGSDGIILLIYQED